ncbi:MAG: trypsin-like peptidase domain-containing protein [Bacteroidales bacterium]|nr:trypsin-like peptidase domain-containing protein [Bacteroidales bacterium]
MKRFLTTVWVLALSAAVGYLVYDKYNTEADARQAEERSEVEEIRARESRREDLRREHALDMSGTAFCDAAEMAVESVVYVKVTKKARQQMPTSVLDMLFGFIATPKDQVGIGSGVIISEDGYIVTNTHVVEGGDKFSVTLYDNTVYEATLMGADPATDLALLKIPAEGLVVLPMADSDELRLGEWVLAIGSPYDLRSTITAGIVSAKGRSFPNYDGQYRVESFIQTDAAVNPGNSGGALVNTDGELVGINTSIVSLTGSYTGYSFAVPANIVKKVTDDFITYGQVQRAVLGISMAETESGVRVMEVKEGSPAAEADVRPGDIVREVNFQKINSGSELQVQINKYRPGERIVLSINREGDIKEIVVKL